MRFALLLLVACSSAAPKPIPRLGRVAAAVAEPPIAERRPHDVTSPNGTRSDPYFWLRDDKHEARDVLAYLEAENAYARTMLAPARPIEDTLVAESRARVDEESSSAPVFDEGYYYYERYERGKQHEIHARKKTLDGPEEVLLDVNALAAGKPFYDVGTYAVSHDGKLLAWTEDLVGKNQFTVHVKNLATGELLPDTATNLAPAVAWANDNQTLFFVGRDPTSLREDRVFRHVLGGRDVLVFREPDASYYVNIGTTKSGRYIVIDCDATTMSESRLIDANKPTAAPVVFLPRKEDQIYELDHLDDRFVIRTNERGANFEVVSVPAGKQRDRKAWRVLVPPRDDTFVQEMAVYRGFVAVGVRRDGLLRVHVVPNTGPAFDVEPSDPAYVMNLVETPDPAAPRVRYSYDSLTTPHAVFEVDPATKVRTEVWRERVPTYDATKYASEYVRAPAKDGARIPVSIVARKGTPHDGTAPLLVLGYGAYGDSYEPEFDRERVSLLDRGWVIAIAHVRGGAELGDDWYEGGRLLTKQNTFTDFIAATEFLVANKYGARDRVFAEGGSAGGLLVAAVANMRPDLYRGMIAWVPFVDVVTTMLDETLPLVTNEYEEWGDPREPAAYANMLAYSPYDNVRAQAYPALYIRTGLSDGLVPYHEPAKWVAKLRAMKTDKHLLVFETDMHAGHSGVTGRYDSIREEARAYAFLVYTATGR